MNPEAFRLKYLEVVKFLKERSDQVIVSGGGALLMLGLREQTSDLDLDVRPGVFERHRTKDNVEIFGTTEIVNLDENVSLHRLNPAIQTMMVSDVCIYSIDELIRQKTRLMNHPERKKEKIAQDKADIDALRKLKKSYQPSSFKW